MPNLSDFKLGNIVFASMLAENKLDFKKSLVSFMDFCDVDKNKFELFKALRLTLI